MRAPATQAGMRQRNLSLVLHAVSARGEVSRAAVATEVGLTRAAVSNLVDELLAAGLLVEVGLKRPGTVGRPGTALALATTGPAGIGVEIGVDRLTACVVDMRGTVRARTGTESPNRRRAAAEVLAEAAGLVRRITAEVSGLGLEPAGITVAVPGLVGRDRAVVERSPNLRWENVPVRAILEKSCAPLPVLVENEANLGALAELWVGGRETTTDFVHVSAEVGIGAALVVEGRLFRGARGFAGELGHVPVWPEGPSCSCGARGCLEQYAGEDAVLRAAGLEAGPGVRLPLLARRAAEGDAKALAALGRAGAALGIALAGTVNLLDPQRVVLGGALAGLGPWLLPSLERELGARVTDRQWTADCLVLSGLGRDGALLGAAHSVVRAILDAPTACR